VGAVSDGFVLREVAVLDESGGFENGIDVLVEDGVIAAVGPRLHAGDAVSYDCSGLWLLPGVVDCHSHLAVSSLDPLERLRTPVTQWALEAARNARRILECGVTTLRDPGGADAGIRDAIAAGYVPGPRLQVAVVTLCQTGGHADGYLPGAAVECSADYVAGFPGRPPYLVDGPDEMRKVVRQVLRAGADWIKLCTTGGVVSPHDDGEIPELTAEEIAVAVFEAGRKGKGVMSHAFGGEGLDNAVRAGVRSIEHGIFLTEEQAALMASKGCTLVPTLYVVREVIGWAEQGGVLPEYAERKALALRDTIGNAVEVARAHGVRIALGSDFIRRELHGRNLAEIPLLHEAGLTVEETLLAATWNGAGLLGIADRVGRIAPGYVFDAILLDAEPSDLSAFGRPGAVTGVFKEGHAALPHPRLLVPTRPGTRPAAAVR
jgi:imidazolonepropionase-like amidohydrolase